MPASFTLREPVARVAVERSVKVDAATAIDGLTVEIAALNDSVMLLGFLLADVLRENRDQS